MRAADPILLVHCRYTRPGGEDSAYRAEAALLEANGHEVVRLEVTNDELVAMPRLQAAARTVWNGGAARMVEERVRETGARLVHVHNTFPLLSPAVYSGARRAGARVVQTLHNYRLACPSALMLRNGMPCEDCVGRSVAWPAVVHGCYRGSRAASAVVATMLRVHRSRRTWDRDVDAFIAVSAFLRDRVVAGGIPRERVHIKGPHLAVDPGAGTHDADYVLYAGRLSEEKGVRVLLEAWRHVPDDMRLRILGDGPLREDVERAAKDDARIRFDGNVASRDVIAAMKEARLLVAPSISYEGAPLVFAEAAAVGLPVVSSGIGAIPESVEHDVTGYLVPPRDPGALAAALTRLMRDGAQRAAMGRAARRHFERTMSPAVAYDRLMAIYEQVWRARIT